MRFLRLLIEPLKQKVARIMENLRPTKTQAQPFMQDTPKTDHTQRAQPVVEKHKVAGISFREDALRSLGTANDEFNLTKRRMIEDGLIGERVYKTEFFTISCDLIPEPDNPADPNAIRVVVDGAHIGYIKKGSCAHIHNLLREGRIQKVSCEIGGGPYKIILTDYDEDGEEIYNLIKETIPFYAVVSITLKP